MTKGIKMFNLHISMKMLNNSKNAQKNNNKKDKNIEVARLVNNQLKIIVSELLSFEINTFYHLFWLILRYIKWKIQDKVAIIESNLISQILNVIPVSKILKNGSNYISEIV